MKCKCPKCNNMIEVKRKFTKSGLSVIEKICDNCGYEDVTSLAYLEEKAKRCIGISTSNRCFGPTRW